ncbi:basic leucine zipper 43-like [Momordica charantia]|uniref:Basic leucine zipper 43-like n=1 Tax=Momordica charantia TaxID=3673 RepID=A0A6J1D4H0_MOMCH|nr:basic leucine zipper 43-like [Momordica charantia]XP_022148986.1 basic leucine zipper 43-like [Momordica charantia]
MIPGEITGLQFFPPENSFQIPSNIGMMQNSFQTLHHFNGLLGNLPLSHIPYPGHEFLAQSSSISYNSTSDEAEEQQKSIIDERRQRRMISNRESARRSRMRKQKHLDELWSQVVRLRTENHKLIDKLNHLSDCHEKVLLENARLKEEASDLRQMLGDLQIGSPYTACLSELEDIPCNTAHLRAESSSYQSITNFIDNLLH